MSTTGQLYFDPQEQGSAHAMALNSTGLGLGTSSPSANLHLLGNAIISQQLMIGTVPSTTNSNLHLNGSLSMIPKQLTDGLEMNSSSIYFANTESSSLTAFLPYASNVTGRIISIKKTSASRYLWIYPRDRDTIDGQAAITVTPSSSSDPLPYLRFVSASGNWYTLETYGSSSNILAGQQKTLFRSIGPSNTSALATGSVSKTISISTRTLSISGTTFADNIGVGDALQYDSNGDSVIDSIAFISSRASSTSYTLQSNIGDLPTEVTSCTTWSVYRAYPSLHSWMFILENTAIDSAVRQFDGSGLNLKTLGASLHVACYADAPENLDSYTTKWFGLFSYRGMTDKNKYIKFYTPYSSSEVGVSQRHSGVWDDNKYNVSGNGEFGLIRADEPNIRFEGLQVQAHLGYALGAELANTSNSDIRFSHNIIKGDQTYLTNSKGILVNVSNTRLQNVSIYNNIVYGFKYNISFSSAGTSVLPSQINIYNNTTSLGEIGFHSNNYGSDVNIQLKNNLAHNNTTDYDFRNTGVTALNNYASDATASPNGLGTDNATFTFINASGNNFKLAGGDTGANGLGVDLSADASFPFSDDIDKATRTAPWDVGADQN
jgi:hypothetical protein